MAKILLDAGAQVDAHGIDGWTPLHSAASQGHAELVRLLLERGADPDARLRGGLTARDLAAQSRYTDVIEVLDARRKLAERR